MAERIVPIEPRHIEQVVDLHLRAFPTFFLTFMGPAFLRRLYRSVLDDPTAFGLVAEDVDAPHAVRGHVTGTLEPAGYYKRMMRRQFWGFAFASLRVILRRPTVLPRLLRRLTFRGAAPDGPPRALLTCICVDPDTQGRGLGRRLMIAWIHEAWRRGATGLYLATDAENNEPANAFYLRCGWRLEATYTTSEGRRMNRYVLDRPQPADAGGSAAGGADAAGSG